MEEHVWFAHSGGAKDVQRSDQLQNLQPSHMFCAVYAAGGGKKRMANFVQQDGKYAPATIFLRIRDEIITSASRLEIIRKTAADEWECKRIPDWSPDGDGKDKLKLEPHWFKTRFWNNKQEKKNPWFAFRIISPHTQHVTAPFPVFQYYPNVTDPNSQEYFQKSIAPLLEAQSASMHDSLASACKERNIHPPSVDRKSNKRRDSAGKKKGSLDRSSIERAIRSASPRSGSPVARKNSGGSFKSAMERRRTGSFGKRPGGGSFDNSMAAVLSRSLPGPIQMDGGAQHGDVKPQVSSSGADIFGNVQDRRPILLPPTHMNGGGIASSQRFAHHRRSLNSPVTRSPLAASEISSSEQSGFWAGRSASDGHVSSLQSHSRDMSSMQGLHQQQSLQQEEHSLQTEVDALYGLDLSSNQAQQQQHSPQLHGGVMQGIEGLAGMNGHSHNDGIPRLPSDDDMFKMDDDFGPDPFFMNSPGDQYPNSTDFSPAPSPKCATPTESGLHGIEQELYALQFRERGIPISPAVRSRLDIDNFFSQTF